MARKVILFFFKMEDIISKLQENGVSKYYDLLSYLHSIHFEKDISVELLSDSFEYEHDKNRLSQSALQQLFTSNHDISTIYSIMFPTIKPIRDKFVGVGSLIYNTNDTMDYDNIGCSPNDTTEAANRLQGLIDQYYSMPIDNIIKPIVGFVIYLLYERIHPHEDGNGRMGRYLFFENSALGESLFPFSTLLNDTNGNSIMFNEIFHFTNFPKKNVNPDTFDDYPPLDKYFDISFINEHIVNRMVYVLYIAKIYKHLRLSFPHIPTYIVKELAVSNKAIKKYKRFNSDIITYMTEAGFDVEQHRMNLVYISEMNIC